MANKYLKGGALNPAWCDEQDALYDAERISDNIMNLLERIAMDMTIDFGGGIVTNVPSVQNKKEMCIISNVDDYEAKFNFVKRHSDTPEDLELAKQIIGLK